MMKTNCLFTQITVFSIQCIFIWSAWAALMPIGAMTTVANQIFGFAALKECLYKFHSNSTTSSGQVTNFYLEYRKLQILLNLFNGVHRQGLMKITIVGLSITQIISFFSAIHGSKSDTINGTSTAQLLFLLLAVDTFFIVMTVFGQASKTHSISEKVTRETRNHYWLLRNKSNNKCECEIVTKHMRSWSNNRIQFFDSNFFESLTPLRLEEFCVTTSANLLLLKN